MLKAIKCAALAVSESSLGNLHAALTAGATAGRLAHPQSLDALCAAVPGLVASDAWPAVVDGWYDVHEAL